MHEATMTVLYQDEPKGGAKLWQISDGTNRFKVEPEDVRYYPKGETHTFNWKEESFRGKDGTMVKYDKVVGRPKAASAATPAGGCCHRSPSGGVPNGNGRQMFVCAIVKVWAEKIPVAETTTLISAIQSAMDAYDQTFGGMEFGPKVYE